MRCQERSCSPRVHWNIEEAYSWFMMVRECIGKPKVLRHALAVHESALAHKIGLRIVCGDLRVQRHIKSPATRLVVHESALAHCKGLQKPFGNPRVHRGIASKNPKLFKSTQGSGIGRILGARFGVPDSEWLDIHDKIADNPKLRSVGTHSLECMRIGASAGKPFRQFGS